ncbi:MAG: hypothetical protein GC179_00675 [Anaerolineaceae bacterium]|nr:hypothetical protein [Anaerolineaceae bacterium]
MHSTNRRFLTLALVMLFVLSLSSAAFAQDATAEATPETATAPVDLNLTYSVTANGEISNSTVSQTWTLTTASADRLNVRVERTGGNLLPDVAILDASDQQLATSYGSDQTGAAAQIDNYTLPNAGTYKVLVQRVGGATGVTQGTYTITVTPRATADNNPNNTVSLGDITAGTPVNGELTGTQWYQRYTFTAAGEDVIRVMGKRTSGTLFPEVEILDSNGTSLSVGYTDYTNGDIAQINAFSLPQAGTYTIAMTRAQRFNGETAGTYELNVTLLGAGESNPLLSAPKGDVTYDTALTGDIGAQWYQDWKLTTTAGDVLTITAVRTSGNLQPEVILLGGSGQEVTHGYTANTGDTATIQRYSLSGPGNYVVRVSRAQGKTGYSNGSYSLMVTLVGSGKDSPTLKESSGAIENTQTQTGNITGAKWSNTWTYQGTKGQVINITVARTSDTLIPHVDIQDSNGQVLTSGYPNDSRDGAEIKNYTLPGTGEFKIVVYRDGNETGYTTGGYSLKVEPPAQ